MLAAYLKMPVRTTFGRRENAPEECNSKWPTWPPATANPGEYPFDYPTRAASSHFGIARTSHAFSRIDSSETASVA